MKNQAEIDSLEIRSFIKERLKNTNDEIQIGNFMLKQSDLILLYEDLLRGFIMNRRKHKIYGADKCIDFCIYLSSMSDVIKIAKDIWENPKKYWEFDKDGDYYYDFLKFLWIDDNIRLADLVNEKELNIK